MTYPSALDLGKTKFPQHGDYGTSMRDRAIGLLLQAEKDLAGDGSYWDRARVCADIARGWAALYRAQVAVEEPAAGTLDTSDITGALEGIRSELSDIDRSIGSR